MWTQRDRFAAFVFIGTQNSLRIPWSRAGKAAPPLLPSPAMTIPHHHQHFPLQPQGLCQPDAAKEPEFSKQGIFFVKSHEVTVDLLPGEVANIAFLFLEQMSQLLAFKQRHFN